MVSSPSNGFAPVPGGALVILGGVEPDAKDPGPQILHPRNTFPGSPALQKRLLRRVLGVIAVAEQVQQGADEFVAHGVEDADQSFIGWGLSFVQRPNRG